MSSWAEDIVPGSMTLKRWYFPRVHFFKQEYIMIKKALVFAVSAACLVSGAAFAQSSDYRNDRYERNDRIERTDNAGRGDRHDRNERTTRDGRDFRYGDFERSARRDDRHDGYRNDNRYDNRHYGYNNGYGNGYGNGYRMQMRRGERLSHDYGRYYVVNDWRGHRGLYAPQRGYQWVQVDNDYALVAIATGIIANVLLNN
jgi:Ni/Co efflux regulator RcnB